MSVCLTPEYVYRMLPGARDMKPGVFCFNPPYGVRMGAEAGKRNFWPCIPIWDGLSRVSEAGVPRALSQTRVL